MSAAPAPLPPESQEPVLQFAVAKRLGYRKRMLWVAVLVGVGMVLQLVTLNVVWGIPPIAAAVLLSWVVGFDNKLDRRGLRSDRAWRRVHFKRLASIVDLDEDIGRWDSSAFDVSSVGGCFAFVLALGGIAVGTIFSAAVVGTDIAAIVAFDGFALLAVQWFSGMRTVHRKPDLVLKAQHINTVVQSKRKAIDAAGELHAQLLLREADAGATPEDARLLIDFPDAPGDLLAVQGQVVLNRVQGKPFPYFYCVVVADAGGGLAKLAEPLAPGGDGTTIEVKSEKDVDVVVVRQTTTKTSGYHTKPPVSRRLLGTALQIATRFRSEAGARTAR